MTIQPGARLGSYRIERLLGHGGMGEVYLATDEGLDRPVALKLLPPEFAGDPAFRRRFLAESRLAASLDHPHIVPIYEAGESDDRLFIAMRYVDGADLGTLLQRAGPLAAQRALALLRGVADALDAAHDRGLVHRDVKPGNILVAPTPRGGEHAYLADFGLVKQLGSGGDFTRSGQIIGSLGYLAPEQIEGRPTDGRADVYSLTCVLYESLTGRPPFAGERDVATLWAHLQAERPKPSEIIPELAPIDPVIARGMAIELSERYATAGELIADALAATGAPSGIKTLLKGAVAPARPAGAPAPSVEPITRGFLFADLRGYSAYAERHGDDAAAQLLERYRKAVRGVMARHSGAEMRTEGDSFYVLFPSASTAVAAGIEIVAEASRENAKQPDAPIEVGVGIHAGETAETAEGPVGSAVNIAARICAQAKSGEVLVSDTVRGLTRTRQVGTFEPVGTRRLKGIVEPVQLFRVLPVGAVPTARSVADRARGLDLRRIPLTAVVTIIIVLLAAPAALLLAAALGPKPTIGPSPTATAAGDATTAPPFASPTAPPSSSPQPSPSAAAVERIVYAKEVVLEGVIPPCSDEPYLPQSYLHSVAPDGTSDVRLPIDLDLYVKSPAFSASGDSLAFYGVERLGFTNYYVITSSGGRVAGVTARGEQSEGNNQIARIGNPSWSPDGSAFALIGDDPTLLGDVGALVVVDVFRAEEQVLIAGRPRESPAIPAPGSAIPGALLDAAWMPDQTIALLVRPDDPAATGDEVWTVDAEGGGPRKLFTLAGLAAVGLAQSPDGDRFAVQAANRAQVEDPAWDIYVVSADGTSLRALTDAGGVDVQPAWSPDAERIAFASDRSGRYQIHSIATDGSGIQQITNTEADRAACSPTWSYSTAPATALLPTPVPSGGPVPAVLHRGELDAGTYRSRDFPIAVEFRIDDRWLGSIESADQLALRADDFSPTTLTIAKLQFGLDPPCLGDGHDLVPILLGGNAPRDVIDWLEGRPELEVSAPSPVIVGGQSGLFVEVAIATESAEAACDPVPTNGRLHLFLGGEDTVWISDGQLLRVWVLDVHGVTVSILVGLPAEDSETVYRDRVRPTVDSIEFP